MWNRCAELGAETFSPEGASAHGVGMFPAPVLRRGPDRVRRARAEDDVVSAAPRSRSFWVPIPVVAEITRLLEITQRVAADCSTPCALPLGLLFTTVSTKQSSITPFHAAKSAPLQCSPGSSPSSAPLLVHGASAGSLRWGNEESPEIWIPVCVAPVPPASPPPPASPTVMMLTPRRPAGDPPVSARAPACASPRW